MNNNHLYGEWKWNGMKPDTCCNQIQMIINRLDRFEREMKQIKRQLANMNNNYYSSYYND